MDLSKLLTTAGAYMPLVVLVGSLVGSPHCLIMCSAFTYQISKEKLWQYHLGRLVSYLLLAAVFLGIYKVTYQWTLFQIVFSFLFAVYFLFLLYRESKSCCSPNLQTKSAFVKGLGTGVLPCSWLLLFLISLQMVESPILYFILIAIFWVGTVPVFYIKYSKFITGRLAFLKPTQKRVLIVLLFIFSFSIHISSLELDAEKLDAALLQCTSFLGLR